MKGKYVSNMIRKTSKEIKALEDFFFGAHDGPDSENQLFLMKLKRDNLIRGIIIELHLSIEDLIDDILKYAIYKVNYRDKKKFKAKRLKSQESASHLLE